MYVVLPSSVGGEARKRGAVEQMPWAYVGYRSRSHWKRLPLGRHYHGEIVLPGDFSSTSL